MPPKPPRFPVPPLPPGFKLLEPAPSPAPAEPSTLADFMGKRLATLEAELAAERERSRAAAARLDHQEALRAESERMLGEITEQLRREKREADSRERASKDQGRIEILEKRLDEMLQGWTAVVKDRVSPPQAKDERIDALEKENAELMRAVKERSEALERHIRERNDIERSMGESLMRLNRELLTERDKSRSAPMRLSELENENALLKEKLEFQTRASALKDERLAELGARNEEMSKLLLAEAQKTSETLKGRRQEAEAFAQRLAEMERAVEAAREERLREAEANRQLRAQVAALAQQLTEALQQRDALKLQYSSWDEERARLSDTLKKKEDMVTLLSSTFQSIIKSAPKTEPK